MKFFGRLVVQVSQPGEWETYPCPWLGHASYRCGKCKKGFFKARSADDHDPKCPECGAQVRAYFDESAS